MADLTIKQVRSVVHTNGRQRDTLRSLKLGRIGRQSTMADSPNLRGMIRVVEHLVEVSDPKASS
jgi:large subunit ribosomal protein L30